MSSATPKIPTVDLVIDQGATFRQPLAWKAKVGSVYVPIDLTGATARMQLRSSISSDVVLLSLTTENGGIALGGAAGTVDLYLTDEQTSALDFSYAVYDLEIVMGSGDVVRFIQGVVQVTKECTR